MNLPHTTSSQPPSRWRTQLLECAAVIPIAVCGGALLGIASAHRAYFDDIVFIIGGLFGAVVGLATAPIFDLAIRNKDWRAAIPAIYGPSLLSALITSDQYVPLRGATWSILSFLIACGFCRLLILDSKTREFESCRKCGQLSSSRSSECPKCGNSLDPPAVPIERFQSRLIVRLLPFLLIPIASVGFHFVFSPAVLGSMSMTELTSSLATNDVQRSHDASQELASRGMDAIQQLIDHPDASVRLAVARALRWVHDEDATIAISNYLADEDRYVRLEAITAIQYDFGPTLLPALEDRVQREKDSLVKGTLEKAIAYLTKPRPANQK